MSRLHAHFHRSLSLSLFLRGTQKRLLWERKNQSRKGAEIERDWTSLAARTCARSAHLAAKLEEKTRPTVGFLFILLGRVFETFALEEIAEIRRDLRLQLLLVPFKLPPPLDGRARQTLDGTVLP